MKVLHISTAKTWRGGEQQVLYLLGELTKVNIECHLWSPKGSILLSKLTNNIKQTPYQKRGGIDPLAAYKLSRYTKEQKIDLIHCHDSHAHSLAYLAALIFKCKMPIVISRRVDFPIKASSLKKYNHHSIKAILCVSDKIKEILSPAIRNKDLVHTVHSGTDLTRFSSPKSYYLRKHYNISKDTILVGNVAALADHKDYDTFIKVAAEVCRIRSDIHFMAIGNDDGEGNRLKALAEKLSVSDRIIFTGYVQEAWKYIHELDVFLFTSKEEGLGTSLLDTLASKVPVVSTDAGGITEIIENEKTGLVSKVGDVVSLAKDLLRLIEDKRLQADLIEGGQKKVSQFSKKETAKKTMNIYGKILADN